MQAVRHQMVSEKLDFVPPVPIFTIPISLKFCSGSRVNNVDIKLGVKIYLPIYFIFERLGTADNFSVFAFLIVLFWILLVHSRLPGFHPDTLPPPKTVPSSEAPPHPIPAPRPTIPVSCPRRPVAVHPHGAPVRQGGPGPHQAHPGHRRLEPSMLLRSQLLVDFCVNASNIVIKLYDKYFGKIHGSFHYIKHTQLLHKN